MIITEKEARELGIFSGTKKKSKYNARKTMIDGIYFDSTAEANYYQLLKLLRRAGKIDGFCRQPRFVVTEGRNGERGTEYVADFVIFLSDGTYKIVDVKGVKTDSFKLKIKSLREKYPKLKIWLEE